MCARGPGQVSLSLSAERTRYAMQGIIIVNHRVRVVYKCFIGTWKEALVKQSRDRVEITAPRRFLRWGCKGGKGSGRGGGRRERESGREGGRGGGGLREVGFGVWVSQASGACGLGAAEVFGAEGLAGEGKQVDPGVRV